MVGFPLVVLVALGGGVRVAADERPETYPAFAYLSGDLFEAVSIASKRVGIPVGKKCRDQLRAHDVHVSREGDRITVVFHPNEYCGRKFLGGGGRVLLDAATLKIVETTPGE